MTSREPADPARILLVELASPQVDAPLRQLLARGLAGVILEGAALAEPAALPALTAELRAAAGANAEVAPLIGAAWNAPELAEIVPSSSLLAWDFQESGDTLELQLQVLEAGRRLAGLGLVHLRGPALDIGRGDGVPEHLFGGDVDQVAVVGALVVEALQAAGLVCSAQAFPGRGALERAEAGPGISNVSAHDLLRVDAAPFLAAAARGLEMFELSSGYFRAFGEEPATCSAALCSWVLGEVGFGGLLVSAPLGQVKGTSVPETARRAYQAGCHLLQVREQDAGAVLDALAPGDDQERLALGRRAARAARLRRDWL